MWTIKEIFEAYYRGAGFSEIAEKSGRAEEEIRDIFCYRSGLPKTGEQFPIPPDIKWETGEAKNGSYGFCPACGQTNVVIVDGETKCYKCRLQDYLDRHGAVEPAEEIVDGHESPAYC